MKMHWIVMMLWALPLSATAGTVQNVLPADNKLDITPENFCLGFKNLPAANKMLFQDEANLICPNSVPSPLLGTLLTNAYQGVGEPIITTVLVQETPATETTQITVAYAMKLAKSPVTVLLGEEKHVPSPYSVDPLTIKAEFITPAKNLGDADTVFTVKQTTTVNAQVKFSEASLHDLKLYRLHPNNFDFFMAARTLNEKQPPEQLQFKRSVVLRGVMRDPSNPNGAYSITVLNFVMNSRKQHDRVVAAFTAFIKADMKALYAEQSK